MEDVTLIDYSRIGIEQTLKAKKESLIKIIIYGSFMMAD